ncbi:MAG: SdrD B-like domain-containing protein [Planctomycetota bacterium]|jgi:hypothetical protein
MHGKENNRMDGPPTFERLEDRLLLSGLLGVNAQLDTPLMPYDATGTVTYDAATASFDSDATPLAILLAPGVGRIIQAPRDFQLHIEVDNAGNLIGGASGDDLKIDGAIDVDGDGVIDLDGVLLRGEVLQFGWYDSGVVNGADQFDFRFQVTGGLLAGEYAGKDIGVWMLSPIKAGMPQFTGDWSVNFEHRANGRAGAIESLAPPVVPSTISGFVYEDFNNDGEINFSELAIENVTVDLVDDQSVVIQTTTTDENGLYVFNNVLPGTYEIRETQPVGYEDGIDTLGEIDGVAVGMAGDDVFTEVAIPEEGGVVAVNYNFGERPQAGSTVTGGQTATIGFWQNKNGQRVLTSVNEGLGDWLATTFVNMYGVQAGDSDLTGMTNAEVADYYKTVFKTKLKQKDNSAAKVDSQVMAVAFAVYVTNGNLAGYAAEDYGFLVNDGVGVATWNVGDAGDAFGVDDNTEMKVIDLLLATDSMTTNGVLYYSFDVMYRNLANEVYTAINEAGDI